MRVYHDHDYRKLANPDFPDLDDIICSERFRKSFRGSLRKTDQLKVKDLYVAIYKAFKESLGLLDSSPKYFVEKRPLDNEVHALSLKRDMPDAKFIHILRDPRTRYLSEKNKRKVRSFINPRMSGSVYKSRTSSHLGFLAGIAANSAASFELAQRNHHAIGDDYLVIKFEDLVSSGDRVIDEICRFLDVSRKESMMLQTILNLPYGGNSSFKEMNVKIADLTAERTKKFYGETSFLERKVLRALTEKGGCKYGYEWPPEFQGENILKIVNLSKILFPIKRESFQEYYLNRRSFLRLIFRQDGPYTIDKFIQRHVADLSIGIRHYN
jgi:hypothetical protein